MGSTSIVVAHSACANIFLSDEVWLNNEEGRTATSLLDDPWRAMVLASHPKASFEQPDNLADEGAMAVPPPNGVMDFPIAGLDVAYSVRSMDGPLLGSPETNVLPAYSSDQVNEPLSFAPVPSDLIGTGVGGNDYTDFFSGSQNFSARSAILFEFSLPVTAFGIFLGDVESRPAGTLAEVRLFDVVGSLLNAGNTELVPTGNVIFALTTGGTMVDSYDVFDASPTRNEEGKWGNGTTQFYGFVDEGPVSKMLLIVGDEDFGGEALSEHLVFVGATAVVPEPTCLGLLCIGVVATVCRRSVLRRLQSDRIVSLYELGFLFASSGSNRH